MKSLLSAANRLGAGFHGSSASVAAEARPLPLRRRLRHRAGFTLVELMVVVAIVAILTAIAYPSYTHYIVKTRRSAAKACLSEYANYMERYYTTNLGYDKDSAAKANVLPALDCASNAQTGNYYGYDFGKPTSSAYTLTATPTPAQPDSECSALGIDQKGSRTPTTTGCW